MTIIAEAVRPHGYARYKINGCRCMTCKTAVTAYERRRSMGVAAGTWRPWTDAGPVREHLHALSAAGIGYKRAAALAGLAPSSVAKILRTERPTRRVRRDTEAALLAVQPGPDTFLAGSRVPAVGTQRRIQALCCMGWNLSQQAARVGWTVGNYAVLLERPSVAHATSLLVIGLYEELSMAHAPGGYSASRAHLLAKKHRWFPPLAWDDDTIDDPAVVPAMLPPLDGSDPAADEWAIQYAGAGYPIDGDVSGVTRRELARRLVVNGWPLKDIADMFGVSVQRITQLHQQAAREAAQRIGGAS